ncbi:MAG: hypothetical protein ACI8UR_002447 [Natronomonas sp.]|jgi:hypothetical protein
MQETRSRATVAATPNEAVHGSFDDQTIGLRMCRGFRGIIPHFPDNIGARQ